MEYDLVNKSINQSIDQSLNQSMILKKLAESQSIKFSLAHVSTIGALVVTLRTCYTAPYKLSYYYYYYFITY